MAKVTIELDLETEMQEARDVFKLLADSGAVPGVFKKEPLLDLTKVVPSVPPVPTITHPMLGPTPPTPEPEPDVPVPGVPVPLDSEDIPWDARIHVAAKTYRQSDMTWKLKRKVDETLVKQVKAELQGGAVALTTSTVPANPNDPLAGAVPPPPATRNYVTLIEEILSKQREGTLAVTDVTAACDVVGIDTAADLSGKPELIPAFAAELGISC